MTQFDYNRYDRYDHDDYDYDGYGRRRRRRRPRYQYPFFPIYPFYPIYPPYYRYPYYQTTIQPSLWLLIYNRCLLSKNKDRQNCKYRYCRSRFVYYVHVLK